MKKLWIALLSAMVIFAFAMPASTVDVKVSGSYFAQGYYIHNPSLFDQDSQVNRALYVGGAAANPMAALLGTTTRYGYTGTLATQIYGAGGSTAYYNQRLRIQTEIKVVEGLSLVTRFDALERTWGDVRWAGGTSQTASRATTGGTNTGLGASGAAGVGENIEFERAYVDFTTGIGRFNVGYQPFGQWGPEFINTAKTHAGIGWYGKFGPVITVAKFGRLSEGVTSAAANPAGSLTSAGDTDSDEYDLGVIYKAQSWEAGLLYQFARQAINRNAGTLAVAYGGYTYATDSGFLLKINAFDPYFKGTFGPVYIEAEGIWGFGKIEYENTGINIIANNRYGILGVPRTLGDIDLKGAALHVKAQGNFGMVYVGGIFDYISGDDPDTLDTMEGGITKLLRAGDDYMPCLLLWNSWYGSTSVPNALNVGGATGAGYTQGAFGITNDVTTFEDNVWMYQLYFGVKPTPKTDVKLSVTYAYADKKPTANAFLVPDAIGTIAGIPNPYFEGKKYGWEVDLTASYKIFDNLTYTVGGAYHFVGDYFKGPDYSAYYAANGLAYSSPELKNNYLLMHRLELSF